MEGRKEGRRVIDGMDGDKNDSKNLQKKKKRISLDEDGKDQKYISQRYVCIFMKEDENDGDGENKLRIYIIIIIIEWIFQLIETESNSDRLRLCWFLIAALTVSMLMIQLILRISEANIKVPDSRVTRCLMSKQRLALKEKEKPINF
jgi:hypothetical protein